MRRITRALDIFSEVAIVLFSSRAKSPDRFAYGGIGAVAHRGAENIHEHFGQPYATNRQCFKAFALL